MSVSSAPQIAALVGVAFAMFCATGCVEVALREGSVPSDPDIYEAIDYPPPSEGSVWPGDTPSGSFLFFDRKARGVGDLVTVLIEEDMSAEGSAKTSLAATSTIETTLLSDIGLAAVVTGPIRKILKFLGAKGVGAAPQAGANVNVLTADSKNDYEGDGTVSRSGKFTGRMACRVMDILPGGVLRIQGKRYVVVNHEAQYISLEGFVRREDIGLDNSVRSTAIADARITYDGLGVVDDKQRPGLVARAWDWVYPF